MTALTMNEVLDLDRFPIDRPDSPEGQALIARCKADLAADGMFNLDGFVRPESIAPAVSEVAPVLQSNAFTHARKHNIYFLKSIDGLAPDHPALTQFETVNHTICADQIPESVVVDVYRFPAVAEFLAAVMEKPALHTMADPLACANVMSYHEGEALNWHFDHSEFTTTLLLQAPEEGGGFEYRTDLRSDDDPNYDGVARLLAGEDPDVRLFKLDAGTLNVFRGKNTPHRVTPVVGSKARIIAVFSYYEEPGVMFSEEERVGFYGRAA